MDHNARVHIDKTQHSINVFLSDMKFKLRTVEEKTDEISIIVNQPSPGVFAYITIMGNTLSFERTEEGIIRVHLKKQSYSRELDRVYWDGNQVVSSKYRSEFLIPRLNDYLREAFDDSLD